MADRTLLVNRKIIEDLSTDQLVVGRAILFEGGGGTWSIIDVDGDETISDGQTGVVITIDRPVSGSGKKVFLTQGATSVEQTVTGETTTTVTITVVQGSLSLGAATLEVWNP